MRDTKKAFLWITDILEKNGIRYKISGGFAAKTYGVDREFDDIDIEVSEKDVQVVGGKVKPYIKFGPARYKDENWDLELLTLVYEGQEIDIASSKAKIFSQQSQRWGKIDYNLSDKNMFTIYGKLVPIKKINELISVKVKLGRDVDIEDIKQLINIKN